MTVKAYEMVFSDYLKHIRSLGRRSFTIDQAISGLKVSKGSIISAISRLKKRRELISPAKGFYVIIPPEYKQQGCIPPEELIPLLMKHLDIDYYAALLSAAQYYGAAHQKPMRFQIITNKQIWRKLEFGQIRIDCLYKKSLKDLPTQNFTVKTGYLKVASPELTALDLLIYSNKSGGLNHIATVLSELIEAIDPEKLIALAKQLHENVWFQRIGFILDHIDPYDTESNQNIIDALANYLASKKLKYMPLAPEIPSTGYPYSKKWMIIENTDIESDI